MLELMKIIYRLHKSGHIAGRAGAITVSERLEEEGLWYFVWQLRNDHKYHANWFWRNDHDGLTRAAITYMELENGEPPSFIRNITSGLYLPATIEMMFLDQNGLTLVQEFAFDILGGDNIALDMARDIIKI